MKKIMSVYGEHHYAIFTIGFTRHIVLRQGVTIFISTARCKPVAVIQFGCDRVFLPLPGRFFGIRFVVGYVLVRCLPSISYIELLLYTTLVNLIIMVSTYMNVDSLISHKRLFILDRFLLHHV